MTKRKGGLPRKHAPGEAAQAPKWVGERERRRSQETGALVVLVDADAEPYWLGNDGGRWVTVCDTHARLANHATLDLARGWMSQPSSWCDACLEIAEATELAQKAAAR